MSACACVWGGGACSWLFVVQADVHIDQDSCFFLINLSLTLDFFSIISFVTSRMMQVANPPLAGLGSVWNGSHLACVDQIYVFPPMVEFGQHSAQPKPPGTPANLSSPSAPHVAWGTLASSLDELGHLPTLSFCLFICRMSAPTDETVCIYHERKVTFLPPQHTHTLCNAQ